MNSIFTSRLPEHAPLWVKIDQSVNSKRMPQALLLIGPRHLRVSSFATNLAAELLCQEKSSPCGVCAACLLLQAGTHPDFQLICSETKTSTIKIDQIRALQDEVYLSPKCGARRVIVIDPADKMNVASANALLKILEEPPPTVYFILVAEQLGTLPATILSRCQQMVFPDTLIDSSNYFTLADHYPPESVRGELLLKHHAVLSALCDVVEKKTSPCTVAATWASYDLVDLVWLLYLILAQAVQMQLLQRSPVTTTTDPFVRFTQLLHPVDLLNQLDTLNAISKKLSHNVPINGILVLENILIGFLRNNHDR